MVRIVKSTIKKVINKTLNPFGIELISNSYSAGAKMFSCRDRIAHVKKIGYNPKCIIDAGAFKGNWTLDIHRIYPDAQFLIVEPNPNVQSQLQNAVKSIYPPPIIEQKALADSPATLKFNIWGDPNNAPSASLHDHVKGSAERQIDVEATTIDYLIDFHKIRPELIKLDLQGAEIKALHGASEALKTVEMFIVEFGCLQAYLERTNPLQLFEIFYDNGYCLYDIVDLLYRPYDGALTGGDFFFVKNSSPLKEHLDYI